jgi:hypothetical protein
MTLDLGTVIFILLSPAAVAAAVVWLGRKLTEKKIDLHFDQKMEQFKHGLAQASAAAEFDYQRRLQDFTLFTEKRNLVYAELFATLERSFEALVENFGPRPKLARTDTFVGAADDLLHERLFMLGIRSRRMRETTIRNLRANPGNESGTVLTGLDMYYRKRAIDEVEKARDCFLSNSIVLKEHIYNECQSYIGGAFKMLETKEPVKEDYLNLRIILGRLRAHMNNEMMAGDYSVTGNESVALLNQDRERE